MENNVPAIIGSFIFFREPIDIAVDKEDRVVVADNGLSAILVFDPAGKLLKTIDGKRPNQKSGSESNTLETDLCSYVPISENINIKGVALNLIDFKFEFSDLILIYVNSGGGSNNKAAAAAGFKDISAVCVAPSGEYVVADSRIQVFTPDGVYVREIGKGSKGGRYGGLCCDAKGFLMATRTEKGRSFIQVFR